MKRLFPLVVPVALIALVFAVSAGASPDAQHAKRGKTLTVVEHATTDATTDTGAPGDSVGDILTFANDVYDAADAKKVGTDQGSCIRVVAGASYECSWSTKLARGSIMVQGSFSDTGPSTLAITGGTGAYKRASGTMDLESREDGAKFAFTFRLKD